MNIKLSFLIQRILTGAFFIAWTGGVFAPARAAESLSSYEMPEVVVTASRIPVSRDKIGSAVTVITAKEIAEKKIHSLQDVFRQTTSIDVFRFGGPGSQTQVGLRGADATQTLILVDGVRIGSNLGGFSNLTNLSTDNIERVEIVRGNQSTLYGSNAIGGVINIITKRGREKTEGHLMMEYGSWQTKRTSASLRGKRGDLRYSLTSFLEDSDGYSVDDEYNKPGLEDDFASTKNFGLTFGYPLTGVDIDASVNYSDGARAGDGTSDTVGNYSWLDALSSNVRFTKVINDRYDFQVDFEYSFEKLDGKVFNAPGSSSNLHRLSYTRAVDIQHNYRLNDHTLTFGWAGEISNGKESRRTNPYGQKTYQRSWYAQDLFDWKDWSLTLGGRVDAIDDDTGTSYLARKVARTFRVTGSRPIDKQTRFHASFGTGFKKPTIFNTLFPGITGNNRLKPERTKGWDAGVEYVSPDNQFHVDVTYFMTRYRDLIIRQVSNGLSVGPNLNGDRESSNHGFEIEGSYDLTKKLSLSFNATFQQSNIQDTFFQVQPEFTRRPDKKAKGTIHYQATDRLQTIITNQFIGKAWNTQTNRTEVLSQATITDVIFNFTPDPHSEWSFRVNNLFDQVHYESTGFTPTLRSTWLTYTWKM